MIEFLVSSFPVQPEMSLTHFPTSIISSSTSLRTKFKARFWKRLKKIPVVHFFSDEVTVFQMRSLICLMSHVLRMWTGIPDENLTNSHCFSKWSLAVYTYIIHNAVYPHATQVKRLERLLYTFHILYISYCIYKTKIENDKYSWPCYHNSEIYMHRYMFCVTIL